MNGSAERRIAENAATIRIGLALLALVPGPIAAWTLIAPRSFYDDFPGFASWVSALPPYNEHLLRDFGAASLAILVVLVGAAIFLERRLLQVALVAYLIGTLPHFGYHLTTTDAYGTADNLLSLGGFALTIALSLALLAFTSERPYAGALARGEPTSPQPREGTPRPGS